LNLIYKKWKNAKGGDCEGYILEQEDEDIALGLEPIKNGFVRT